MTKQISERRTAPLYKENLIISYLLDILQIIWKYSDHFQPFKSKAKRFATLITYL